MHALEAVLADGALVERDAELAAQPEDLQELRSQPELVAPRLVNCRVEAVLVREVDLGVDGHQVVLIGRLVRERWVGDHGAQLD